MLVCFTLASFSLFFDPADALDREDASFSLVFFLYSSTFFSLFPQSYVRQGIGSVQCNKRSRSNQAKRIYFQRMTLKHTRGFFSLLWFHLASIISDVNLDVDVGLGEGALHILLRNDCKCRCHFVSGDNTMPAKKTVELAQYGNYTIPTIFEKDKRSNAHTFCTRIEFTKNSKPFFFCARRSILVPTDQFIVSLLFSLFGSFFWRI